MERRVNSKKYDKYKPIGGEVKKTFYLTPTILNSSIYLHTPLSTTDVAERSNLYTPVYVYQILDYPLVRLTLTTSLYCVALPRSGEAGQLKNTP